MTMKLATFNINGINQRLGLLLDWLKMAGPDVACLQELKAEHTRFPLKAIQDAGYGAIWQGQKSWNGVAILAKGVSPIETRRGLPGDASDEHSRYLEAAIDGVVVGCLYLPNGNPQPGPKFAYKLAWFERLNAYAKQLMRAGHPVALCGDFNVVPTDFDIYDTKSWKKDALLQPQSRAAFEKLLAQGWTDSLRSLFPEERIYTFWDYFRNHWARNAGLRIDHILLTPDLKKRLKSAGVDRDIRDRPHPSDHAPVWIELADRPSTRQGNVRVRRHKRSKKSKPNVKTKPRHVKALPHG